MIPGYEHLPRIGAGAFTGGGAKLGLHTTEGSSVAGAIAALDKNRSWSHFLLSFEENRKIQFLEVDVAGKSMSNDTSDGYQTNRANMIQVEICGFARETPDWSKEKLGWLADRFNEIRGAFYFPLEYLDFQNGGRLSDRDFVAYSGIVGHKHAPDNDHYDPGMLDVDYIVRRMKGEPMSADALTDYEVTELYKAYFGIKSPPSYDRKHVGRPLSELIAQFRGHPEALMNMESRGQISKDQQKTFDELYLKQVDATKKVFGK